MLEILKTRLKFFSIFEKWEHIQIYHFIYIRGLLNFLYLQNAWLPNNAIDFCVRKKSKMELEAMAFQLSEQILRICHAAVIEI